MLHLELLIAYTLLIRLHSFNNQLSITFAKPSRVEIFVGHEEEQEQAHC